MRLRIAVELADDGADDRLRELSTVLVSDDGTSSQLIGNYEYVVTRQGRVTRTGSLLGWDRSQDAMALAAKILSQFTVGDSAPDRRLQFLARLFGRPD